MQPVLFSIGDINIYGYGLMFALGILLGVWLSTHLAKKTGADADFLFSMAVWVVVFGFLGSKILHILTVFPDFLEDPLGVLKASITQGFVVYGASIAGILTIVVYCRKHKKDMWRYLDLAMPGLALGQAIGRIGCFLAGCCYGIRYDGVCAVHFPSGSSAPAGVGLFPVQLVSVIANLLLMAILLVFLKKNRIRGRVTALWLMLYALGRGLIEIVRDDPRGNVWIFSTSQFISLILFIIGAALFFYLTKHKAPFDPETDEEEDEEEDEEDETDEPSLKEAAAQAKAEAKEAAEEAKTEAQEAAEEIRKEAKAAQKEAKAAQKEAKKALKDAEDKTDAAAKEAAQAVQETAETAVEDTAKAQESVEKAVEETEDEVTAAIAEDLEEKADEKRTED